MAADPHARIDAPHAAGAMQDEECEVPAGMTLREWRAAVVAERQALREAARAERGGIARRLARSLKRR